MIATDDLLNNPERLSDLLTKFYMQELLNETEEYSLARRQREVMRRTQRAHKFYQVYKQYEEEGFPLTKVKEFFHIDSADLR